MPSPPPPSPTDSEGEWGGAPLAPGDTPYPEDHPNHQLLTAPPAPPPAPGILGGLFHSQHPLSYGPLYALALGLEAAMAGLVMVGAPMATWVNPWFPDFALLAIPALTLTAAGAHQLLMRLHAQGRAPLNNTPALFGKVALVLVTIAWLGAGISGAQPPAIIPWGAGILGLITLVLSTRGLPPDLTLPPLERPWILPQRLAHSLTLGAGILIPGAVLLGAGISELTLASRLLSLGLLVQVGLMQRQVGADTRGGRACRVGRLCVAYRWVLWLGGLLPMVLLGLYLLGTPLGLPALTLAGPLGGLGALGWTWLGLRGAQEPEEFEENAL